MKTNNRIGKLDIIILTIVALVLVGIYLMFHFINKEEGARVRIEIGKELYGIYSLSDSKTIEIMDSNGQIMNLLEIKGGHASMLEATCPDKLCVHQKAIHLSGESIVCLPHKLVVTIENEEHNELDGIAN